MGVPELILGIPELILGFQRTYDGVGAHVGFRSYYGVALGIEIS